MNIRPVKDEASYRWALAEIEPYFVHEPAPGTPEADRFDILAALIEAYEARSRPVDDTAAREALTRAMEKHATGATDPVADAIPSQTIDLNGEIASDRAAELGRLIGEAFSAGATLPDPLRWVVLGRFAYGCAVDEAFRMRGLEVN